MKVFLLIFYNILMGIAAPAWFVIGLFYCLWKGGKLSHHFKRLGLVEKPSFKSGSLPVFWIHALSVGEVNSIIPLIKAIQNVWPHASIICTASTITGMNTLKFKIKNSGQFIHPAPYDFLPSLCSFIHYFRPDFFIIVETDIWPNLMWLLKKKNIHSILVNGSISSASAKRLLKLRPVAELLYSNFDQIIMQSDEDMQRLTHLKIPRARIKVLGNLKFDLPIDFLSAKEIEALRTEIGLGKGQIAWIAGSTHEGEEAVIMRVHMNLKIIFPNLQLILAPRNPNRSDRLMNMGKNMGLCMIKKSSKKNKENVDVIILDTLGELARCYSLAEAAFVGGSLAEIGGHNLLEPASHGVPVIFGPHVESCMDMANALIKCGGGRMVSDEDEIFNVIKDILGNIQKRKKMGENARKLIIDNTGSMKKHIDLISQVLNTK